MEFSCPEDAAEAYDEWSQPGKLLDKREITVDFALDRGSDGGRSGGFGGRGRVEY